MASTLRPLLLACLVLASVGGVEAQIPEGVEGSFRPHPQAQEAISRLLSPYCPGFMLEVCPAAESIALRDSIQALAIQGAASDELVEWVLANHGREHLAVPPRSGWGLWAWLLPPLALLIGAAGVSLALRRLVPARGAVHAEDLDVRALRPDAGADREAELASADAVRLREAIRELELSEDPL